jgi:dolichol-phosphate mannosyltransferase
VVTTTWNERDNIGRLIPLLRRVLVGVPHEVIVVDDSSIDGTIEVAMKLADVAVQKPREGQSKGLLYGMKLAKYPVIVTIDADLENDPKYIPRLIREAEKYDVVIASRTWLPRVSERIASAVLGGLLNVRDVFSNFRAYRIEIVPLFELKGGETFGAEFLVIAKKKGLRIGEISYEPPPRREKSRVGGRFWANMRIMWALVKSLVIYLLVGG